MVSGREAQKIESRQRTILIRHQINTSQRHLLLDIIDVSQQRHSSGPRDGDRFRVAHGA
jgi:hypothetical protein